MLRKQTQVSLQSGAYGTIVLLQPITFTFMVVIAVIFATATGIFLFAGSHTRHVAVEGQVVADRGVLELFPTQSGIVSEKHVIEGQSVRAGDVLFVISDERSSASQGLAQAAISESIHVRSHDVAAEIAETKAMQVQERDALLKKVASIQAELSKFAALLETQRSRLRLAEAAEARLEALPQGFASKDQMQQKSADVLDQRSRLYNLELEQMTQGRELASLQAELSVLSLKQRNQIAPLTRALESTSQELTESEVKRRFTLVAPSDGTATAVTANLGQHVDITRPLVSIVPASSTWHVELYAPTQAIGFVRQGTPVQIRYGAFPYQKFGLQKGHVDSVARIALPLSELTGAISESKRNGNGPYYRINVKLDSQTVLAYGQQQPLRAGMLLDADILQDKRRLYEWMLEPLFSLSGKL